MNSIKLRGWLLGMFMLIFTSQFLVAQRIAYVDLNELLQSMPEYQEAQRQLDNISAQWRREISEEYDDIKSLYNKYQAEQVLMSEDVRLAKEEEIMKREQRVRELQREKFGPEGALFKRRQQLVEPIQEKVYEAIESYANSKDFDFIFDKSGSAGMIFSNDEYDKTEAIKRELGI